MLDPWDTWTELSLKANGITYYILYKTLRYRVTVMSTPIKEHNRRENHFHGQLCQRRTAEQGRGRAWHLGTDLLVSTCKVPPPRDTPKVQGARYFAGIKS